MNTTGFGEEDRRKLAEYLAGLVPKKAAPDDDAGLFGTAARMGFRALRTEPQEPIPQQALDDVDFLRSCGIQP